MGLEDFSLDGGESISADALERLMEQMRENAAAIRAIKQQEKKQRDKDNKLFAILMKFIKGNKRQDLVTLIIRLLNENVPAGFILAIILLGNDEIQNQAGIILALPSGLSNKDEQSLDNVSDQEEENQISTGQKLILKMWTEAIIATAIENPYKILRTVRDAEGNIKLTAIQLTSFIIRDFFEQQKINRDFQEIHEFAEMTLMEILLAVEKKLSQSQLSGKAVDK